MGKQRGRKLQLKAASISQKNRERKQWSKPSITCLSHTLRYSIIDKVKAVIAAKELGSIRAASRKLNISEYCIRLWSVHPHELKRLLNESFKEKLRKRVSEIDGVTSKRNRLEVILRRRLRTWFLESQKLCHQNVRLSKFKIRIQAIKLSDELGLTQTGFNVTGKWLNSFIHKLFQAHDVECRATANRCQKKK